MILTPSTAVRIAPRRAARTLCSSTRTHSLSSLFRWKSRSTSPQPDASSTPAPSAAPSAASAAPSTPPTPPAQTHTPATPPRIQGKMLARDQELLSKLLEREGGSAGVPIVNGRYEEGLGPETKKNMFRLI